MSKIPSYYDTVAAAVADIANINIGDILILKDRASSTWDVIAHTGTEDEYGLITGNASKSFKLRVGATCNIAEFGAFNDGSNAAINAAVMVAASTNNTKLLFHSGTYNYNSQVLIDSLDSIEWEAVGDVTLYDECKSINFSPSGTGMVPVGIRFTNCGSVTMRGFKTDSAVTTSGTVITASENERYPYVDFQNCEKVFLDDHDLDGYVGAVVNNLTLGPAHMMRASYFRFNLCTDVTINNLTLVPGMGRGEIMSFAYCDKLKWDGCYYKQGAAAYTFASLGKIIMTNNVELSNFDVQSETTSSMFDLLGLNITLRNMNIDAPYSNIDISAEWSIAGAVIDNLTQDNVVFNGSHAVTTYSGSNKPEIKTVKILNNRYTFDTVEKFILSNRFTEQMIVDNFVCHNGRNVVWAGDIDANLVLDKDMILNNPTITSDKAVTGAAIAIDVTGRMEINNPSIDLWGYNKLLLKDAKAVSDAVSLTTSDNHLTIEGGSIRNCIILIYSNVTFKNVTMFNVTFESLSVANGGLVNDPTIRFENCTQELTDANPVANNSKFFADIQTGSCKFIGHRLTGVADTGGNPTFVNFTSNTVDLDWQGGYINCARTASGTQYLFNHDNDESPQVPRSAIIHGGAVIGPLNRTLITSGTTTTPTEYTNLRFINVQWEKEAADTPFVLGAVNADRLRLVFSGTNINGTGWSYILARTAKVLTFINDGNTESNF